LNHEDRHRPRPGELVSIEIWDCEGIESPWGWQTASGIFESEEIVKLPTPRIKHKIRPDSLGLVLKRAILGESHRQQIAYWCIVEGLQLLIPSRFICERKEI
jgi:hypothetical protein